MGKYLLLMYGKEMKMPKHVTKEMMEKGMKPWRDYLKPLMKKGAVVSASPVGWKGKMLTPKGVKNYNPRSTDLQGYMIISAKSMPEALKIARKSPHAEMKSGLTTVREIIGVPI